MKKYIIVAIIGVSFIFGMISFAIFQPNVSSATSQKEYKVLEFKNVAIGKRDNRMESALNDHAAENWRVVSISSTQWELKRSTVLVHTVILERDM